MLIGIHQNNSPIEGYNFCGEIKTTLSNSWKWTVKVFNKHTDLISSVGILAITTCLLASKILKNIPVIIPRLALIVFNFGGIIWLNVQVRDLLKSCHDLWRMSHEKKELYILTLATKVFLKTTNIFLTCATFTASVIAVVGFPQITMGVYAIIKPLALANLAVTILSDVNDYFVNKDLLKNFECIEIEPKASRKITKIIVCFLAVIKEKSIQIPSSELKEERKLANKLICQLDTQTLETFQDDLNHKGHCQKNHQECRLNLETAVQDDKVMQDFELESLPVGGDHSQKVKAPPNGSGYDSKDCVNLSSSTAVSRLKALKLFYTLKDSMQNKQSGTIANLSLIALGYFSMGLCRLFPNTLIDMATRWSLSVLYTDELIRQKLFQLDLAEAL